MEIGRNIEREAGFDPARHRFRERAARRNGEREHQIKGRNQADHRLPGELFTGAHPFRIVIDHLAVVVDPAHGAVAECHEEHDPDKAVREVGPQQG